MIKLYYIEYSNSIKFFQGNKYFELIKNENNFIQFQKVLDSGKYNFINLLQN